jgi:hypothetical protein
MSEQKITHCCFLALLLVLTVHPTTAAENTDRQAEVTRKGAKVMPFSLEKTQHQFTKTEHGGIQRVVSRDPLNQEQINLIRQHLEQLSKKFAQGDFSGPESIHGANMPGLAQLKNAKPGSLQIIYTPEPDGASLNFKSTDSELIKAVHSWFDAQLHDHGHDALLMHHLHNQ